MDRVEIPNDSRTLADTERQLLNAHAQLAAYARDLKLSIEAEREHARELAQLNARLQRLDQARGEFVTFLAQEVVTPLTTLCLAVDSIETQAPSRLSEPVVELRRACDRLRAYIDQAQRYFSWLAAEPPQRGESSDLEAVVRMAVDRVHTLRDDQALFAIDVKDRVRVQGEAQTLSIPVHTVLDNAVKFSGRAPRVEVEICRAEDGFGVITVRDAGRGFPSELAEDLLRPFGNLDLRPGGSASGMSLALAVAILVAHGGTLEASSPGIGGGATFRIGLPLSPLASVPSRRVPAKG